MKPGALSIAVTQNDHIFGRESAPVTLVEYGDFECRYCGEAFPVVVRLRESLEEEMRFVYRHFPIASKHKHAKMAAEAAESAGAQGRFWDYHDTLFRHQHALEIKDLIGYAKGLSLDAPKFEEAIIIHTFLAKVEGDYVSGISSGVEGTPTFFIDGQLYDGSVAYRDMYHAIIKRAREKGKR
jgi:protein-disulfide isomerase